MTPESQRIALAKWAGWKLSTKSFNGRTGYRYERGDEAASTGGGLFGWGWQSSEESAQKHLPDYLHDLNAVHELEEKLKTAAEAMQFAVELSRLVGKPFQPAHELGLWEGWKLAHATAAQRCEALLRTLGLWEA